MEKLRYDQVGPFFCSMTLFAVALVTWYGLGGGEVIFPWLAHTVKDLFDRYFVYIAHTQRYVEDDDEEETDDTPVAEPQRASNNNAATSNNGVAISQNEQQQVVVVAAKAAALAALVAAGKVGETEGIRIVFGCAPSSSNPKYLTARAALKLALSALEDGPRFVVRDENGEAKLDANGKLVTAPRNGRKED